MQDEPGDTPYQAASMLLSVFIVAEIIAAQLNDPDLTTAAFREKHENDISQYLWGDAN